MARNDITPERVRALLSYDPATGIFTRRTTYGYRGCKKAGTTVGSRTVYGYIIIAVDGHRFFGHRLAWAITYGRWPSGEIDHIDGDRSNDRINNLRDVTRKINQQNRHPPSRNNRLGVMGVKVMNDGYMARIHTNGRTIYLGTFATTDAAHDAYLEAKRRLHPGFIE